MLPNSNQETNILAFSLVFLTILTMFGTAKALCDMAGILNDDGSIPRGRFIILIIGGLNIASGMFYGPVCIFQS